MPRDADVYLEDMLTAIGRIQEFTRGLDGASFQRDARTVDALLHNLEVIGKAAKHVPDELWKRTTGIEWRKIGGLRDLIAHA